MNVALDWHQDPIPKHQPAQTSLQASSVLLLWRRACPHQAASVDSLILVTPAPPKAPGADHELIELGYWGCATMTDLEGMRREKAGLVWHR